MLKHLFPFKIEIYIFLGPSELIKLVRANPNSNYFMDEVLISGDAVSTKILSEISKTVSKSNFIWIACQSDKPPNKKDKNLQGMFDFSMAYF